MLLYYLISTCIWLLVFTFQTIFKVFFLSVGAAAAWWRQVFSTWYFTKISHRFAWISLSVVNAEISVDCDIYSVQFVIVISHQFYCKEDRLRGMLNNTCTEQTYYVIVMTLLAPIGHKQVTNYFWMFSACTTGSAALVFPRITSVVLGWKLLILSSNNESFNF